MSRDVLLFGLSRSLPAAQLLAWKEQTPDLHDFMPDYHRLQLEHWIWSQRGELGFDILDIGVENPRRWLGEGYVTFGESDEDIGGDLLALPFPATLFDTVLLTEVLEHCTDPRKAMGEVWRVLKPGGRILVTSPFLWPDHRTEEYRDYWRFTEQGWQLLLEHFVDVEIVPCALTDEGVAAYDFLRRFECMGFTHLTKITTGYLCSGRKPA